MIQSFELVSGSYDNINPTIVVDTSGNVTIQVDSTTDLRYTGNVVIQ